MSGAPSFPFNVRDWFVDTAALDVAEEGAYIRLLCYSWAKPLPTDPAKLARIVRVSPRRWDILWKTLTGFFVCTDEGVLINKRLERERRNVQQLMAIQSTKGKQSGAARRNRGSVSVQTGEQPRLNHGSTAVRAEERFQACWEAYPKREGTNSRLDALKAFKARLAEGADPAALLAGVVRYATYLTAKGKIGTEYVMQASRFFGAAKHYTEPWEVAAPRVQPSFEERNDDALKAFYAEEE